MKTHTPITNGKGEIVGWILDQGGNEVRAFDGNFKPTGVYQKGVNLTTNASGLVGRGNQLLRTIGEAEK